MQLSKRLQAVAEFVTPGNRVADIGCDHAYISIFLAEKGLSQHIIAMDINQGPIERALENVKKHGFVDKIEVRRSNGMQRLLPGEVDTALIAGMGGALMKRILSDSPEVMYSLRELVLQPQSEIHLVRMALAEHGFLITRENMLLEDGKYYICMKAEQEQQVSQRQDYELTRREHFYFGRLLLEDRNPVLFEFLKLEKAQCDAINKTLITIPTPQSLLRQKEIYEELGLIERGFSYYN